MYGYKDLKQIIEKNQFSVDCPVINCTTKVVRQRNSFKCEQKFYCPNHKIFISPSTFEYETEEENLLWIEKSDRNVFNEIKKVKRESRIARDNSEDALTWNVFR